MGWCLIKSSNMTVYGIKFNLWQLGSITCHHMILNYFSSFWFIFTCDGRPLHNLINSCPNHTKLSIRFKPWNCWGIMLRNICWPIIFHTITTEMLTDGARSGRCDQSLSCRLLRCGSGVFLGTMFSLFWASCPKCTAHNLNIVHFMAPI